MTNLSWYDQKVKYQLRFLAVFLHILAEVTKGNLMSHVYAGKFVRFDLSTDHHTLELIAEHNAQTYLLGSGFAAKLFYDEMDPSIDPLDPRAVIYIFNGLLSGTFAPTGCRSSWCGRSPLTGIWNEANLGGHWGVELRFAGYDGIVIMGKAARPSYLYINGDRIELRDASHLWSKDTFEVHDLLIAETDEKARAAIIGVAGENWVKIAGIVSGGHSHARMAARGGMGALLGSKNLKAIVTRGKDKPQYADTKGFHSTVKDSNKYIMAHGPAKPCICLARRADTPAPISSATMPSRTGAAATGPKAR
jgi:aldehyde:ferredoxin oxidoreductase